MRKMSVVFHIQRIGCQPQKLPVRNTVVASPAHGMLNRENRTKISLAAQPPPPPPRCSLSIGENKIKLHRQVVGTLLPAVEPLITVSCLYKERPVTALSGSRGLSNPVVLDLCECTSCRRMLAGLSGCAWYLAVAAW